MDISSIKIEELNAMCRICLHSAKTFHDIYTKGLSTDSTIADNIMECAPVQISHNDNLPTIICLSCMDQLQVAYQFRSTCVQTDVVLHKFLEANTKTVKIEELVKDEVCDSSDDFRIYVDETEYTSSNEISLEDKINNIISKNNQILHTLNVTTKEKTKKQKCVLKTSKEIVYESVECEDKLKIQTVDLNTDYSGNEHRSELPNLLTDNCNENDEGKEKRLKKKSKNKTIVLNNDSPKLKKCRNGPMKQRKVDKTRFKCHLCIKTYPIQSRLDDHMRTHTGEYPFQCSVCKRLFTSKILLSKHKRIQHSNNKRYMCEMCGKFFKHSNVFARHKLIHTGEKPYQCDACPKSFTNSFNLQVHKRVHTGEKPFQCEICAKTFAQSPGLLLHKRSHNKEPSDRSCAFRCTTCNKRFKSEINLNIHKLMHTTGGDRPYRCSICDKRFGNPVLLKRHLRTHSGEKPFVCEICHKCFTRKSTLQEHIGIHSGEKPYECRVCGKRFAAKSYLSGHKRIHMPERKLKV